MNLKEIGEFGLIDRIKKMVEVPTKELLIGIEDDTAAFRITKDKITLLSTDVLIEGVHFYLDYFNFYQLGWRAMAINLSDIAAMGGLPQYAVVTLGLPYHLQVESVEELYRGMHALADEFDTTIIGGDTSHSPDRVFISLAVVGWVEESRLTRRSGAQIGDALFVTGTLGGAQAGLKVLKSQDASLNNKFLLCVERHLTPRPRIKEARLLVERFPIHSMIDISDGLASEVNHICKNSQVGAIVFEEHIPLEIETKNIADFFGDDPVDYSLHGGEDFEILFTTSEHLVAKLQKELNDNFGLSCTKVGKIVDKTAGVYLKKANGEKKPLIFKGYDHFQKNEFKKY